jgi:predicted hydrocarbon binding protein
MGLKGWIGYHLKMRKTSINIFQALVAALIDYVVQDSRGDINLANEKLQNIGKSMAETLLFEYSDKIGQHATTFDGFLETFNLALKVMLGITFDEAFYDPTDRKIVYVLEDCPICENVRVSDEFRGLKYCNVLSGVFQHVLTLRGFKSECEEVKCKTWGDDTCTWELRDIS